MPLSSLASSQRYDERREHDSTRSEERAQRILTKTIDKTIDRWIHERRNQKVHKRVIACEPFSYFSHRDGGI
jgi:hypothetical protein